MRNALPPKDIIETILPQHETKKQHYKDKDGRTVPTIIWWGDQRIIRSESFLARIRDIAATASSLELVKIGIIGDQHTGKTSLSQSIAHALHRAMMEKYRIPFTVTFFDSEDLINFRERFTALGPAHRILIMDDVSFVGGVATPTQSQAMQKAVSEVRHLQGAGRRIILIYSYHYSRALLPWMRQANFEVYTSVGESEQDYLEKKIGPRRQRVMNRFREASRMAKKKGYWKVRLGTKGTWKYDYRSPFIPVLWWDGDSLRQGVSPERTFLDGSCDICDNWKGDLRTTADLDEMLAEGRARYGRWYDCAVKLKLYENGYNTYSQMPNLAKRWLDERCDALKIDYGELAAKLGLKQTGRHRIQIHGGGSKLAPVVDDGGDGTSAAGPEVQHELPARSRHDIVPTPP